MQRWYTRFEFSPRRILLNRLLNLLLVMALAAPALAVTTPTPAHAQAGALPKGVLLLSAGLDGDILCPGDPLVFRLRFLTFPDAAGNTASIDIAIPDDSSYVGHTGEGATHERDEQRIHWEFPIAPPSDDGTLPTLVYTVTVDFGLSDGALITGTATGTVDDFPLMAKAMRTIHCNPQQEPLRNPVEFPALAPPGPETESFPRQETNMFLPGNAADASDDDAEPTESVLEMPLFMDLAPPGYVPPADSGDGSIFLPLLQIAGGSAHAQAAPASVDATTRVCDEAFPWVSRHGMSEAVFVEDNKEWESQDFRPIAVSANGSGNDARYATLWVKDKQYGKDWGLWAKMSKADYTTRENEYKPLGLRPIVVDLYGTTASPLYAAIWVKDNLPFASSIGLTTDAMQASIDDNLAKGYRPVWVSGLGNPADNDPRFAGLWVQDSYTGTMRINLTASDLAYDGLARTMANDGFRLVHISGYETKDGVRYAAVWIGDGPCTDVMHEAFRDQTSTQYQVKASVQRSVSATKTVDNEEIFLTPGDMPEGFVRVGRVALRYKAGETGTLKRILPSQGLTFQHGDILVLQVEYGQAVDVAEDINFNILEPSVGNIALWRPAYGGAKGQTFGMNDYQYRLVLQYNAVLKWWVELQRNEVSPDYYWPTSIDEFTVGDDRLYNSVWQAGPSNRAWRVTGIPAGPDFLADFDLAMQRHMQRRNIPGGALAITVDGRLMLARSYTWEPAAVPALPPDARFRLASVSKPLTAIGVLMLSQAKADGSPGPLNLDTPIKNIPGFDQVLKSNDWVDTKVAQLTTRQLLYHLGGWDRDIGVGDYMLADFSVCKSQNLLPTNRTSILNHARAIEFDKTPGYAHAYSNFGYMLLGLIIETLTGKSYGDYMTQDVFAQVSAGGLRLGNNAGNLAKEVRYYTPNNRMDREVLNPMAAPPAGYDKCNWSHQRRVPSSYGTYNITPMDAHGGWVASAIDLVKVTRGVDNGTLMSPATRSVMWARPEGRSRRVASVGAGVVTDLTLAARDRTTPPIVLKDATTVLLVGKGLEKFGRVDFEFATPGEEYEFMVMPFPTVNFLNPPWNVDNTYGFVDSTDGFSQDGSFTFTPPDYWSPMVIEEIDPLPRYYLMIIATKKSGPDAALNLAWPSGETRYALGWNSWETQHTLTFKNRVGNLAVGDVLVGEQSKAAAVISTIPMPLASSGELLIDALVGGPFRPNEKLLVGNVVVATAADREWVRNAGVEHGGLLWGSRAALERRSDGISFAVLFNHDAAYDPYWYLPSDMSIVSRIHSLINDINTSGLWPPGINLFPEYP